MKNVDNGQRITQNPDRITGPLGELLGCFMKANCNPREHKYLKNSDTAEAAAPSGYRRHLREKAVDECSRLVIIFGYFWIIFELLSVHKSIVLSEYHLNYSEHAFAILNCLVFAKVLLTRNCLWDIIAKLARCVRAEPHPRPRGPACGQSPALRSSTSPT